MLEQFPFLENVAFGNTLYLYLKAGVFFVCSVLGLFLIQKFVIGRIKKLSKRTTTDWDDFVIFLMNKKILPILYVFALYIASRQLTLSAGINRFVNILTIGVVIFQITRLIVAVMMKFLERHSAIRKSRGESTATKTMGTVVQLVIWTIAIIFLLDNLGINVSAVVAGLGIGGVAVALAAQNILGDLFNYFVIFFDKPFEEGDFIIVDDYLGVIEHIGIKTTRIRSLGGEQIVFANSNLTGARVRNYKRMRERRVLFTLGVTYQTPSEKMKKIPGIVRKIIDGIEGVRFDRTHFSSFGDFSLNIEVVYYVLNGDYNKYMDLQEKMNVAIQEAFEKEKIEFAYPTQTLFMEKGQTMVGAPGVTA